MEDPTSSTRGKKRKSPSESNNKESDEKQETVKTDSAPKKCLKKTKKSKYSTILKISHKKDEKINSNQPEKHQSE
uniref:Uncharacterized protein n=1 Tax=Saimiri boliviensis boliviensis TaxID=39432 RepID=A0A2K6TLC3_SAIBB